MNINIATNLKRLRRAWEMTQEELAGALGVSPQSVSNWERGDCYPDTELMPRIATYFDVTMDELFGMEAFRDEKRLADARERGGYMVNHLQHKEFIALWREMARDFPHNSEVQLELARALLVYDRTDAAETEAVPILEKIIERGADGETRWNAIYQLALLHAKRGETEKAVAVVSRLAPVRYSREHILPIVMVLPNGGAPETTAALLRDSIGEYSGVLHDAIQNLIHYDKDGEVDEHIALYELATKLMVISLGWEGRESAMSAAVDKMLTARISAGTEDDARTLRLIEEAVACVTGENFSEIGVGAIEGLPLLPDFNRLRDDPRFKAAAETLERAAKDSP